MRDALGRRRVLAWLMLVAMLATGAMPALADEQGVVRLEVTIGKSQVVELKEPFTRVSVTNPAVADVFVVTPNQLLVSGKAVGTTSLVVFYPRKTVFFDIFVQTDLALLRERLKQVAPKDEIDVQSAQESLILTGTSTSEQVMAGAVEVASVFAPKGKVISLLSVSDIRPQQVLLQVHVAEATRQALKELGFSVRALGDTLQAGATPGNAFFPGLGTLGAVGARELANQAVGRNTPDFAFPGSNFFLSTGARDYAMLVRALAERDLFRTLAKPNLVTHSGREAKFLSGGEFPYPVAQENNRVTVEFKEFGVGILFTPTVVDGDTINLKIRPEVSSLDFSQGLVAAGFAIPVLRKNQAATNISLRDGETFAIAGLINNEVRQQVAKIPILGDIPILGTLFRSTRFQNNETELLFLVTVKLVKPDPVGSPFTPDAAALFNLREKEKKEFTLVPGIPAVGEIMERPFGQSDLPPKK
ncbi:MAG TPA: type II and III secretion system protein family protein [Methylomirabilota bacterium]|nr:type II and III secretion system protein family protein [Methylomirabilota bacterium]